MSLPLERERTPYSSRQAYLEPTANGIVTYRVYDVEGVLVKSFEVPAFAGCGPDDHDDETFSEDEYSVEIQDGVRTEYNIRALRISNDEQFNSLIEMRRAQALREGPLAAFTSFTFYRPDVQAVISGILGPPPLRIEDVRMPRQPVKQIGKFIVHAYEINKYGTLRLTLWDTTFAAQQREESLAK